MSSFISAEIFGYLAAFLTTSSFLPQAIKIIKTGNTNDISLFMYILFNIGVICWFLYGIVLDSYPMIIANIITFSFTFIILIYKLTEKKRNKINGI